MKIAIYAHRGANHQQTHADAFQSGLRRHGISASIYRPEEVVDCDLAVVWGHRRKAIIDRQKRKGRRYLVMERGYVGDRFQWTSLGYDGLNGQADFCNQDVSGDRWDEHLAHLMQPWRKRDGYALVMGQVRGDAALAGVNWIGWVSGTIAQLKALGHDVRFRPHPKDPGQRHNCQTLTGPLENCLEKASLVVTWNSNSGVDAALAGVPVVAMDRRSMAWDIAAHGLETAGITPDRTRWAHRLAWCQWRLSEIQAGVAWDHLKSGIGG